MGNRCINRYSILPVSPSCNSEEKSKKNHSKGRDDLSPDGKTAQNSKLCAMSGVYSEFTERALT